jgi:soluble lytic murein transglycosylase-like protein
MPEEPPATLPADFFSRQDVAAPATLPATFFQMSPQQQQQALKSEAILAEMPKPGAPKPPLPLALGGPAPAVDPQASPWTNYWRGALTPDQVGSTASWVLNMPRRGVEKIEQGVEQIAGARQPNLPSEPPTTPGRKLAGGASQIIRGTGEAIAPVALPAALVAAPIPTAVALGAGALTGWGVEKGAQALGAAPEYSALLGDLANVVAGGLGPKASVGLLNRLKVQPGGSAAAAELVKFADEHKIPLSAAARTGIERLRQWQAKTAGSRAAQRSQAATEEGLARTAEEIRGGPAETRERAGGGVAEQLRATKAQRSQEADVAYTQLRDIEAAHPQPVVTGSRRVDTGLVDARGNPIIHQEPITETISLPVDMTGAKSSLGPLVEPLARSMPLAQRQASVGLQAIHNILEGPDTISASDADLYLGAIKTILREQNVPPRSRYLLRQVLDRLDPEVDRAVAQGGPEAVKALAEGRRLTRAKYAAEGTMKALRVPEQDKFPLEPVKLFKKLATPDDVNIGVLRNVQRDAPDSLPAVGRALLEGLFDAALGRDGKLDPAAALKKWNQIGDASKGILFRPEQVTAADRFFRLAELEGRTPRAGASAASAPAARGNLSARLFDLLALMPEAAGLLTRRPAGGGLATTVGLFGLRYASRALARALWNPETARMLTEGIRTPGVRAPITAATSALGVRPKTAAQAASGRGAALGIGAATAPTSPPPTPSGGAAAAAPRGPQAFNTPVPSERQTEPRAGLPRQIQQMLDQKAAGRVPAGLVRAIAEQESGGNAFAQGPEITHGPEKGQHAQGLMQLTPSVQRDYGVTNPFDPEQSAEGGISLLRDLMRRYHGHIPSVVAAYYWGAQNLNDYLRQHAGRPLPKQIQDYVDSVTTRMGY